MMLVDPEPMSAVERFSRLHDAGDLDSGSRLYSDLIPISLPLPGQQYGFEVDLDACSGCQACVTACHSLNGLDDDESWRSVGFLHAPSAPEARLASPTDPMPATRVASIPLIAFPQSVTTACHHCVEPACLQVGEQREQLVVDGRAGPRLQGCPVDAYEKDPVTGIVSHLDDQCIGCGYCTLTCPYEVPRFNESRGIVRKCDMCRDRLGAGEAPACVQACPTSAIRISVVDTAVLTAEAATGQRLVPGAPPSSWTIPTTVYRTTKPAVTELQAADHHSLRPAHAHPPLAVMLVLTQLAVGSVAVDAAIRVLSPGAGAGSRLGTVDAIAGAAMGLLALAASLFHLGRPRYGFRAVIGFRHSWLSREIVAFGAFAVASVAAAGARIGDVAAADTLAAVTVALGLAGVWCSVMIYAVTRRRWWRARTIGPKFALSGAITGSATVLAIAVGVAAVSDRRTGASAAALAGPLAITVMTAATLKGLLEVAVLLRARASIDGDIARTARLLTGELAAQSQARFALLVAGALGAALVPALSGPARSVVAVAALAALVAGELIERSQFFRASVSPRMPGGLA